MNSSLINKVQQGIERKLTRIQVFTFCVFYKRPNYLEMLNNASSPLGRVKDDFQSISA